MRIKEALIRAERALRNISETPQLDARVLLEHTLLRDHAWLLAHGADAIDPDLLDRFHALIRERRGGTPVAYITGYKEFWSLRLEIDNSVLVPRPETEHLVEQALRLLPKHGRYRVADLGTGSGAIALAIARERPACEIVATDISAKAIRIAGNNARRLGLTNVRFVCGDWYSPLSGLGFDLIVSNPPYIGEDDPCLAQDGLAVEPALALKSGVAGLDALHIIGLKARKHLRAGGTILVEHGSDQEQAVKQIFEQGGLTRIVCHRDHAGHTRVTVGKLPDDAM